MVEYLYPADEKELADMVRDLPETADGFRITGGGSRLDLGQTVKADHFVSTASISGVVHYDPGALSLVVRAGTRLSDLMPVLDKAGQRLAFEPADHRALLGTGDADPTAGGMVACGVSGPARIRYGACRDSLLGVRFVNGMGEIIKNGGQVMKNVTGYDLVKFLCGSYGTLGILTELSFKTAPKQETERTFIVTGMDDVSAVSFMSKALGLPLDITGAAHIPGEIPETCLRVEGRKGFVETRLQHLHRILNELPDSMGLSTRDVFEDESRNLWQGIREVHSFAHKKGDVWKISLKASDGPLFMADIRADYDVREYYDWGGSLIWLLTPPTDMEMANALRTRLGRYGGHATLFRADKKTRSEVPVFQPEPEALRKLAGKVKRQFDPRNILNPGLMDTGDIV